ncbi:hypothetical protein GQ53DRAFT_744061 [Thozetella sp. PMI_491]|nr:hypothetical protein GQ53DRAFT_744061 [Thozetella sp. PMI_491]
MNYLRRDTPVCQTLRKLCFNLAMVHDAAMYMVLAETALYGKEQSPQPFMEETDSALQNYTISLGLVAKSISMVEIAVTNAILGTVVGLASYDLYLRKFKRWGMHMTGLRNMIQGKGGISMLQSSSLKIAVLW